MARDYCAELYLCRGEYAPTALLATSPPLSWLRPHRSPGYVPTALLATSPPLSWLRPHRSPGYIPTALLATPHRSPGYATVGSELNETDNEPPFRVFKFLTPKKFFSPDFPFFRGSVRSSRGSPWLRHKWDDQIKHLENKHLASIVLIKRIKKFILQNFSITICFTPYLCNFLVGRNLSFLTSKALQYPKTMPLIIQNIIYQNIIYHVPEPKLMMNMLH